MTRPPVARFILGRLGSACSGLGQFATAVGHYQRGLAIAIEIANPDMEQQFKADTDRARMMAARQAQASGDDQHPAGGGVQSGCGNNEVNAPTKLTLPDGGGDDGGARPAPAQELAPK